MADLNMKVVSARITEGAPWITHLSFTDDSLIFGEAKTIGASNLMKVLQFYANYSGQLVNFTKSNVFFNANVDESNRSDVGHILGVPYANNLERYLGRPCIVGRNKKRAFPSLRDKIRSRISSWSTRLLFDPF
ncbi:hypothetical protein GOBAR_DD20370 [Gossypium barbadense]|nr:hypothetical protein GOBAR_DD20370 [Gossypium barbadense]